MVCLAINPHYNAKKEMALLFEKYPELCDAPEWENTISASLLPEVSPVSIINLEHAAEDELEERQKFIERYVEQAVCALELVLEEGSRGIAYFATTKL